MSGATELTIFSQQRFWFNDNPRLAIPLASIPYLPNKRTVKAIQRAENKRIDRERKALKKKKVQAIQKIESFWQMIKATRQLQKMRIQREIELLPSRGIAYVHAMKSFHSQIS